MNPEAIIELQKAVELSGQSPTYKANLARAHAASGSRSEAINCWLSLKNHLSPVYSNASEIALIYTGLGDSDQAMYWLQKGYEERFRPSVLLRPGLDPLRNSPRFQALVRRIGLPD
jgi:hypothetical protein